MFRGLEKFLRSGLMGMDAEAAHGVTIKALKHGLLIPAPRQKDERLAVTKAGLTFANPLGIAAGFDKNAEVPDAILRLGFGFAEVGTITPVAQSGNPKPRVFRLVENKAVINRLGFNNGGAQAALTRLRKRAGKPGLVGVNIGANKDAADRVADYASGIETFYDVAGYFTVNVSSPNTPGLRNLQAGDELKRLVEAVEATRAVHTKRSDRHVPVFLKIAPALAMDGLAETVAVVKASSFEGMVVSNTTLDKTAVASHRNSSEAGGLSGEPLFERSTHMLAHTRRLLGDDRLIIGVGGITNAQTAIAKLEAGADVVQVYTGFVYAGPHLPIDVRNALSSRMDRDALTSVSQLTGLKTAAWTADELPLQTEV